MLFWNSNKNKSEMFIAEERNYILNKDTDFSIREAYNALRSNITFSVLGERCKVISISSTLPSEGKSINALNVALSFADIGKKVLLIDCDLRKPKLHSLLNIESTPGFSNIIVGDCDIDSAIRRVPGLRIDVICSGDIPPVSTRLLESEEIDDFFYYIKRNYDYVFLDTPPIEVVIDSCVLAKHTNGTVFVVKENYASKEKIVSAVKQLEFAGGKVLGYILNGITTKKVLPLAGYKYRKEYRYIYEYDVNGCKKKIKSKNQSDSNEKGNSKKNINKSIKSKQKEESIKEKEHDKEVVNKKENKEKKKLFTKKVVKKVPKKSNDEIKDDGKKGNSRSSVGDIKIDSNNTDAKTIEKNIESGSSQEKSINESLKTIAVEEFLKVNSDLNNNEKNNKV